TMADSAPAYPYSIYLGSYRDLEGARAAVSQYAETGLSPYWSKIDLGDQGIWYRVFAGHFQTRGEADVLIKKKQIPDAETKNTKYAVLIGSYRTEGDADKMRSQLMSLGFSSYVIEKGEGDLRLYVGAFYQKARAEKQHSELASRGIQGKLVNR
ncbi:MAG: SPOR domain-containing protein, partial [Desulfobacterales bacterium]|nr:SPOR domain-containing protein [Desulfobacterales bacterium]